MCHCNASITLAVYTGGQVLASIGKEAKELEPSTPTAEVQHSSGSQVCCSGVTVGRIELFLF